MGKFIQLYKLAAPRWAYEIERLSPADQKRIADLGLNERSIRQLGMGSSNLSDLVATPKGLLVRKLMKVIAEDPSLTDISIRHRMEQTKVEKELRELAAKMAPDGKGPFAHLLGFKKTNNETLRSLGYGNGVDIGRAYYDYVPGVNPEVVAAKKKLREMDERYGAGWDMKKDPAIRRVVKDINRSFRDERRLQEFTDDPEMGRIGDRILNRLKNRGHTIYDVRGPNIVNGKLVDFEGTDLLGRKQDVEDYYRRQNRAHTDLTPNEIRKLWMQRDPVPAAQPARVSQQELLEKLREKHRSKIQQPPASTPSATIAPVATPRKIIKLPLPSWVVNTFKRKHG